MVQLGKVVNPASQEATRDLDGTKGTISLVEMLEQKTKGNLTEDEEQVLRHVLTGLRMNYLDELKKGSAGEDEHATGEAPGSEGGTESDKQSGAEPGGADDTDVPKSDAANALDEEEAGGDKAGEA